LLEADVEEELRIGIELLGGQCLKFTVPGRRGAPDRIILMPGGLIVFVELKTIGGVLESWQKRFHTMLRSLGFRVEVLWTKEQVRAFFPTLRSTSSRHTQETAG